MGIEIGGKTYTEGLTHPATFHVDDVFATALLRLVDPDFPIWRGTPDSAGESTLVYDQGGGEFDHHGIDAKERPNGVPYSSFGLLWEKLGTRLCDEDVAREIDETFVQPIDEADCKGTCYIVATMIADIQEEHGNPDDGFAHAVNFAQGILTRRIATLRKMAEGKELVTAEIGRQGDPEILVLDKWQPGWQEAARANSTVFCVFPSSRGGWAAQGTRKGVTDGGTRVPYPIGWRAKDGEELAEASGVEDAMFCHKDGFIASAESRDGAIELARRAMALSRDMG